MLDKSYENFFVNLANKKKLEIILALKEGPMNVTEIAKKIHGEQSAVSHSLKDLTSCKILNVKKAGKQRVYSLNKDTIMPILKLVETHSHKYCLAECGKNCEGCRS